jgi:hypothetical protein
MRLSNIKIKTVLSPILLLGAFSAQALADEFAPESAIAGDILSEAWQGKHAPTGELCRLQHRNLEFSYPELFVSIPTTEPFASLGIWRDTLCFSLSIASGIPVL